VLHLVRSAAARQKVPEELVLAVIQIESGFRPEVCSHAGACGLMQLMPRTAASLARRMGRGDDFDIADPAFNIEAGTTYLAYLLELFDGDVELALAGYNAGPMRVRRWVRHGQPITTPVRRYVANVLAARERFARRDLAPAPPPLIDDGLDQDGLRALLREKEALYGDRPDEPLPESS
jgi:soluble lytic murein transglycosylase-like protein